MSKREPLRFDEMPHDVAMAVKAAANAGVVDSLRVSIMGGSFGGYLAVCSAILYPSLYNCVISNCGVFDWERMQKDSKGRLNDMAYDWYSWLFNSHSGNKNYLKSVSPINRVKAIQAPVLLCGGFEDQVVDISQSDRLYWKPLFAGKQVERFYRAYEGHGFAYMENRIAYYEKILDYLAAYNSRQRK